MMGASSANIASAGLGGKLSIIRRAQFAHTVALPESDRAGSDSMSYDQAFAPRSPRRDNAPRTRELVVIRDGVRASRAPDDHDFAMVERAWPR